MHAHDSLESFQSFDSYNVQAKDGQQRDNYEPMNFGDFDLLAPFGEN